MEKFCPACSRVYNDDVALCEVDGERLVLLNEEPSLVGHVLDGKYTLISKLGEGGMGSVYLAEQATMGREVAIKVLRREFSQNRTAIKRFLREARAASKLAHPNTITVYDFGQSNDGLLYLVMERLSGRPLADILDQDGVLAPQRASHIFGQICDSLAEAHKQGITHRDLKPENIFIEQKVGNDDFVKVLDFGIAKMQGDDATGQATATGMICGTPSYMSPEQAMGKDIDGRSDIYALGILLYEMLTNEKPFEGDTPMEVMLKHINEPPPDIYQRTGIQVPQGVQETIERLLSKKADQRPDDCQQAKHMLIAALTTPLIGPVHSTSDPTLSKKRRSDTDERMQSLEKTGLSHTLPARSAGFDEAQPKKSPRWFWWGAAAAAVVVAIVLLVALPGNTKESVDAATEASGNSDEMGPGGSVETPVVGANNKQPTPGGQVDSGLPGTERLATSAGGKLGDALAGVTVDAPAADNAGDADIVEPSPDAVTADGGSAVLAADANSDAEVTIAVGTVEVEPERKRVRIEVLAVPEGAQIFEGEAFLGTAPMVFERDRDSGTVKLSVRARGYRPHAVELGTVNDVSTRVELRRATTGGASGQIKEPGGKDPTKPGLGGTF